MIVPPRCRRRHGVVSSARGSSALLCNQAKTRPFSPDLHCSVLSSLRCFCDLSHLHRQCGLPYDRMVCSLKIWSGQTATRRHCGHRCNGNILGLLPNLVRRILRRLAHMWSNVDVASACCLAALAEMSSIASQHRRLIVMCDKEERR